MPSLPFSCSPTFSAVATVDGVGGNGTLDPTFPTSYANITAALAAVHGTVGDHTIDITTVGPIDEPAGLLFNIAKVITIDGHSSRTHVRIAPGGIGASGGQVAIAVRAVNALSLTFNRLIITPGTGAAGPVSARGLQIYNDNNIATTADVTLNDVMFTGLRPTGHPQAGTALSDPFFEYENTRANRLANIRSFNGGASSGLSVIDFNNTYSNSGGVVTLTLNRSGVSHSVHSATAAAAGGLNIARTQGFHIQINGGSFFTFLDNSGIRSTTTAAGGNGTLRIQGTQANPVVSYRNGWMLDSASTGRNEGAQLGLGVNANPVIVDYFYAIQNYQEGIEVNGGTSATLRNVISAENQNALESGGTAPNVATAANLFVQSASTLVRLQDSVLFNNVGQTANDNAFRWNPAAGASLSTIRTIICGTGDQGNCAAGGLTWTDVDTAVVTAGPHAMEANPASPLPVALSAYTVE